MPSGILIHPLELFRHNTPTSQTGQDGHTCTDNGLIGQGEPFYKQSPKNGGRIDAVITVVILPEI